MTCEISPELVERMVALVRAMSVSADRLMTSNETKLFYEEAIDLVKFMPQPPDPVLIAARELVAERYNARTSLDAIKATLAGEDDDLDPIQNAMKAIRKGMELSSKGTSREG